MIDLKKENSRVKELSDLVDKVTNFVVEEYLDKKAKDSQDLAALQVDFLELASEDGMDVLEEFHRNTVEESLMAWGASKDKNTIKIKLTGNISKILRQLGVEFDIDDLKGFYF